MKHYCHIALALLLGATACPLLSDADAAGPSLTMRGHSQRVQDGIDLIYSLRFSEADDHFREVIAEDPDNPLGHFFLAMVGWWRVLIDLEDRTHDDEFLARLADCIEVCDRRLAANPDDFDAILFKGGSIGFRGRLRGDRAQYLRAAGDGVKSLPLLKRSRGLDPANKDILFGQAIYNYFTVVIPEAHPVVRPVMWLLDDGDRELGLRQLEEVANEGKYARIEARYFLAQICRIFEKDNGRALSHLEKLHEQYPDNALFHRYRARTLAEMGRWEEGLGLYEKVIERSREGMPGYHRRGHIEALYYVGKRAYFERRYDEAVRALAAADSLSSGLGRTPKQQTARGFVALANLCLGMVLDAQGKREEALQRYARVRQLPVFGASHKLARKYEKQAFDGAD